MTHERLAEMDRDYCVVRFSGKTRIFTWEPSDVYEGARVPVFYAANELSPFFAHESVRVARGEDSFVRVPLLKHWLSRATTPRAIGLTMEASDRRFVDGRLNLWSGFGVEPTPGSCSLLRAHIRDVISDDAYVMKWLAWTVQNPTKPAEVALVLRGLKGTGKGLLPRALLKIFASQSLHISKGEQLTGRFNKHLMNCCFIFLDEAIWPGDKAAEGTLKRIVTERTLTIEPKGLDAIETLNRLSILMSSNEDWIVPASADERRFACFDVSNVRRGDHAYFNALSAEIENGGAAAMFADLLAIDLGDWHPRRDIPQTAALASQQAESAAPEVNWLWRILEDGRLPDFVREDGIMKTCIVAEDRARAHLLYLSCKASDQRLRYLSQQKFWKFLEMFGVVKTCGRSGMIYTFLPLREVRMKFLAMYLWHEPFSDDAEWFAPWDLATSERYYTQGTH